MFSYFFCTITTSTTHTGIHFMVHSKHEWRIFANILLLRTFAQTRTLWWGTPPPSPTFLSGWFCWVDWWSTESYCCPAARPAWRPPGCTPPGTARHSGKHRPQRSDYKHRSMHIHTHHMCTIVQLNSSVYPFGHNESTFLRAYSLVGYM